MGTVAVRLAADVDFSGGNKLPEIKSRLLFVLCALILARIGTYIPIPGVNLQIIAEHLKLHTSGALAAFNMLAGGALFRMSVFALGIMPYASAWIIIQLMSIVSTHLTALQEDGDSGRRKIKRYTLYVSALLAFIQGYGIANWLESIHSFMSVSVAIDPSPWLRFTTAITLVAGATFLAWLGEKITARGIGNGISLIIFSGIVAGIPGAMAHLLQQARTGALTTAVVIVAICGPVALAGLIVLMERAQRRILVQYPKRQVGLKIMGGESTHMPLKLNISGVSAPISAASVLLLPVTFYGFIQGESHSYLDLGQPLCSALYLALIILFSFISTSVALDTNKTAKDIIKYGGFIGGTRPGKDTAEYLDFVSRRLTTIGAIYVAFVCVLPDWLIGQYNTPIYLGGTSILISIVAILDIVSRIHRYLVVNGPTASER